ncbi:(2Fe-2S)-binding protein [Methylococcus sp. BF19-07]|uniref:(2Fe-2S)-binding protein n=2 Tax=Methylococcus capsulatus TaxID=414 RepID=A0ABZ2FAW6_METCP|nr:MULTISPECIES: (2Fe-2S)-binding protein [Methylococcus]MDF9393790.1 (2Fe-2S)-binding protein [Methylococcus capsulatus]
MGDAILDERHDVICRCSGTTAWQIRRQFDKGLTDIDGISRATGACSGCGACDADIMALLAEYLLTVSPSPN